MKDTKKGKTEKEKESESVKVIFKLGGKTFTSRVRSLRRK